MIDVAGPDRGVATVTLRRPDRRNALDLAGFRALAAAWRRLDADPDVRVVVVTGAGGDFSSGADLASIGPGVAAAVAAGEPASAVWADINLAVLRDAPILTPVVAAVTGICFGAGMELVGGTDIRIAARSARFALPEVRHGVVASGGSLARLPRQIPYAVAMQILLTGAELALAPLLAAGFLNDVVADDEALPAATAVARVIAANSPAAVRAVKAVVTDGLRGDLSAAFDLERQRSREVLAGPEAAEGARAFAQRRPPSWRL